MKYFFSLLALALFLSVDAQILPQGGCVVTFNIGNQTQVCSSQNVFVLPSGSPSGGVYGGAGVLDDLFFPSIAGPGEHIITYSFDDGFCIGTAQDTIVVVTPQPIVLAGDFEICEGEVTTITASNATEIEWSTNTMGETVELAPAFTTIYSVSGFDENFCITSEDFTIVVHSLPDVVISGNSDICPDQSTELIAFGAVDYAWSTIQFTEVIVVSPQSNMSVCVTGTDGNGCTSGDCIDIILHENPEIIISGDTDVCIGASTTLQASGGIFYQWNTGSSFSAINYTPLGGDEVCVTGEDQFGCFTEICVQMNLLPNPQLILNGDASACVNDEAVVVATGAESYEWSNGDENDSTVVFITGETTLEVIGTGANGCTAEGLWTILAFEPPILEIEGNTAACYGDVITLIASGAESYAWNYDFISPEYSIEILEDTTIIVVGVSDDFCSTLLEIELTLLIPDQVEISGMEDVCPGETIVLTASGSGEYLWSNGSMGETAEYVLSENTVVSVTGTGENGCSDVASELIQVLTGAGVDITGDLIVCPGDTIVATINGLENPVWDNDTLGLMTYYALAESGPISVTGINSQGCLMTYSENATINPLPDLAIEGDLLLCAGETTTLQASGANEYVWSTGDVEEIIELNPSTDIVLTLEGLSNLGCTGTLTVVVEVNEFTPVTFELSQETICDNAGSLSLSASPTGGVFSGEGVSGSAFTPSIGMDGAQNISYTYTNEFGCTSQSTQTIVVDNCSGVDEMESFSFVLYPNPAVDHLTITSDVQGAYTLMIVNAHGQLVRNLSLSSSISVIDITDLSTGMYELVLMHNGKMTAKRFVKG